MSDIIGRIRESRVGYREQERREIAAEFPDGQRVLPLTEFFTGDTIICELKKASPSRGIINDREPLERILDEYREGGAERFSVLTERMSFGGDWRYLHKLKQRTPQMGFLRKDFLYSEEDIRESWLIGADAVLLIAAMLEDDELERLIVEAHRFGLQVLCEAHTAGEVRRICSLAQMPDALGINARDLGTFRVNICLPFALRQLVPKNLPVILESGIRDSADAHAAGNADFSGMLIGELLMRSPQRTRLTASLMGEFEQGKAAAPSFFTKLMQRYSGRPLVKLCGITREEDAEAAVENGADVLGFILAPSRRQIEIGELKRFSRYPVLKVAVVADADAPTLAGLDRLLESGVIDGVQFHGHESRELVRGYRGNAYKALIPRTPADIAEDPFAPFTLYDRPKNQENDSLGTPFGRETAAALQGTWIAGGITPDNLEEVVRRFSPILVDIASGVEKSPGIKDHDKIRAVRAILRRLYG